MTVRWWSFNCQVGGVVPQFVEVQWGFKEYVFLRIAAVDVKRSESLLL